MLDAIRMLMTEALGLTTKEVNDLREALLIEQATEDARYAATSALAHPKGSTTPINEAFSRAQLAADKARDKAMKDVPKALALLLAAEVAMQRRDEAKLHRDMKEEGKAFKQETGLHAAAADWFERLARHGVHPHYLKQHSNETVAIIADLITWKAKDAKFADADNPWRAILGIYAGRVIDKPGQVGTPKRSKAGMPKGPRHRGGSEHYRFDLMVLGAWSCDDSGKPDAIVHDLDILADELPISHAATQSDGAAKPPLATPTPAIANEDAPNTQPYIDLGYSVRSTRDFFSGVKESTITSAEAIKLAEELYEVDPRRRGLYWPKQGYEVGNYDPKELIPALEAWIAQGAWKGAGRFLEAVRQGQAREFIERSRRETVNMLATRLLDRDPVELATARDLGFKI